MDRDLETGQAGPGRRPAARHRHRRRARRYALADRQRCRPSPRSSRRASSGCGRRRSIPPPATSCARRPTLLPSRASPSSRCSISRLWLPNRRKSARVNDIAIASITLGRPVAVDTFADNQPTGAFLIVDAITGATVAGGVISAATKRRRRQRLGLQADARACWSAGCAATSATATRTAASSSGAPARRRCSCTPPAFR